MNVDRSDESSLLVFGAHPDDIEFGCGGIVAQETRRGRRAHIVVCSRGESATNGTPEERVAETDNAARALGASLEFMDLGGDAHFEHTAANSIALAAVIRRARPAIVLAPTLVENQHPDHVKLGRLVRDAARLARFGGVAELRGTPPHSIRALYYYAITADAEPRDAAPLLIDVSPPEVIAAWTDAMRAHASQLQTRDYVELQLTRARLHGQRCGAAYAMALFPNDPPVFDSLAPIERTARRF